jgi:hypothetical protein
MFDRGVEPEAQQINVTGELLVIYDRTLDAKSRLG